MTQLSFGHANPFCFFVQAPKIILIPNIFREKIHRIKLPFITTIVHRPKSTLSNLKRYTAAFLVRRRSP